MSVQFQVGSFSGAIAAQGEMRERHRRAHELRMASEARAEARRTGTISPRAERAQVRPLAGLGAILTAPAAAMTRLVAVARLAVGG